MITAQAAVMVVFGVIACFAGYSLFRTMLPMWGFILGGWVAFTFLPVVIQGPNADTNLYKAIAFIGGGLVGAIIAIPLYFVIIFLSGAVLGGVVGILFGAVIDVGGIASMRQLTALSNMAFPPIPSTATQFVMMAIFGIILGLVAINFQKFMIIASSAFVGAAALISGLTGIIAGLTTTDMSQAVVMLVAWMVLGLLGMFIQFRLLGET
jgi:hypothetical protein